MANETFIKSLTKDRNLTELQSNLLRNFMDNGYDPIKAGLDAGYSNKASVSNAIRALRNELLEITNAELMMHAPKAAQKIVGMLDGGVIPQAQTKLMAAKEILDRVGVVKIDKSEVKVDAPQGIFILPQKKDLEIPIEGEYIED